MSAKNVDQKGRWRTKFIGIRMSEEENEQLDKLVKLSGLSKQDYIMQCVLNHEVTVQGNPRVFYQMNAQVKELLNEVKRLQSIDQLSDEQTELMNTVFRLYSELIDSKPEATEDTGIKN